MTDETTQVPTAAVYHAPGQGEQDAAELDDQAQHLRAEADQAQAQADRYRERADVLTGEAVSLREDYYDRYVVDPGGDAPGR